MLCCRERLRTTEEEGIVVSWIVDFDILIITLRLLFLATGTRGSWSSKLHTTKLAISPPAIAVRILKVFLDAVKRSSHDIPAARAIREP